MDERVQQTREMLAAHHRDGEWFAQLMKESFTGRFDDDFWQLWQQWMAPAASDKPLVLDLGTGPGLFLQEITRRYPSSRAVGIECAPYMLAVIPDECEVIEADLHDPKLPFADGEVDLVMASVVLHEMHQPIRTLLEMARCLKTGGRICIFDWVRVPLQQYLASEDKAVFDSSISPSELDDTFIHFIEHNRFSVDDLVYMLQQTGFELLNKEVLRNGQFARLIAQKT